VTEPGDGVAETARHLGRTVKMCGRWQRAWDTTTRAAFPGHGRMAADKEEVQRLRDDKKRLRMARAIGKKALGFFAHGSP
jgi:transposase-like protein